MEKEATHEVLTALATEIAPVGRITVTVTRIDVLGPSTFKGDAIPTKEFGDIPEKAVKLGRAISHAVGSVKVHSRLFCPYHFLQQLTLITDWERVRRQSLIIY